MSVYLFLEEEMKFKKLLSPALLVSAAMIWGFAFAAQDAASEVPAFTLGAVRSLLAGIFLVIIIPIFDRVHGGDRRLFSLSGKRPSVDLSRSELIGGAICGVILALASALQQIGIASGTDGGKAAFITALYVVLVPIYGLALKRRAPLNVWISVGIAVVGFYFLCINDGFSIATEDLLVVGGALVFPFHILAIDRFAPKCDGVRMSMVQFFVAAAVNAVLALILDGATDPSLLLEHTLPVLFLGIGSSGIAYTLQIVGQKGTPPAAASILLSLESVFGVIGTAMFLGQTLRPREYIGCAIVLLAVILSQLSFGKKAIDSALPEERIEK